MGGPAVAPLAPPTFIVLKIIVTMPTEPSANSTTAVKKKCARDFLQGSCCHKTTIAIPITYTPSYTGQPSSLSVKSANIFTTLGTSIQSDTVVKLHESEVNEDTLNMVMHDIPGEEKFVSTIRAIRKSGQLLHDPTHKKMPARISAIIDLVRSPDVSSTAHLYQNPQPGPSRSSSTLRAGPPRFHTNPEPVHLPRPQAIGPILSSRERPGRQLHRLRPYERLGPPPTHLFGQRSTSQERRRK